MFTRAHITGAIGIDAAPVVATARPLASLAHRSTTGEGRAFWLKMAAHWNENQTSQYKAADCGKPWR
jgi:hypothetical protein